MICILAGSKEEAHRFVRTQEWGNEEWFCPLNLDEIKSKKNFHTLVIGTFWDYPIPSTLPEEMYRLAKIYGYKR